MSVQIPIEVLRNSILSNNKPKTKINSNSELNSILNGLSYLFNMSSSQFDGLLKKNTESLLKDDRIPLYKQMDIGDMLYYDTTPINRIK